MNVLGLRPALRGLPRSLGALPVTAHGFPAPTEAWGTLESERDQAEAGADRASGLPNSRGPTPPIPPTEPQLAARRFARRHPVDPVDTHICVAGLTEDEAASEQERLARKWASVEALVGSEKRLALVADDLVKHFEARLAALDGKAMIVCMSRRICVALYDAIVKLRPQWHS